MDRLIARLWSEGLQAVQTLVQRWVVGSAGARTMSGAAAAYGSEGSSFRFTTSGNPIGGFTNCIDGLDGLVAGCMAVSFAALAGYLLGFLLWNWSLAKVFMGDVCSTFLGAVFAGLVLRAPSWPEAPGLLLVAGAVVNANAQLHTDVLLNSGAVVDHDAICASASGAPAALAVGWCPEAIARKRAPCGL